MEPLHLQKSYNKRSRTIAKSYTAAPIETLAQAHANIASRWCAVRFLHETVLHWTNFA